MRNLNLLLICCYLLPFVALVYPEDCEQKSSCECEFSDGTSINLESLFRTNKALYFSDQKNQYTVYFHGCEDFKFPLDYDNITGDTCRNPAAICYFDSNSKNPVAIAHTSSVSFKISHDIHTLTYSENGVNAIVDLVCTPDYFDDLFVIRNVSSDAKQFNLALLSKHACRTNVPMGLSTGSKLLIMFFTFSLVYIIGGACLAYFIRGARGRELIPNVDFWMSLPGLVKDGFLFLISGCSTNLVTTSEAYDQI